MQVMRITTHHFLLRAEAAFPCCLDAEPARLTSGISKIGPTKNVAKVGPPIKAIRFELSVAQIAIGSANESLMPNESAT
jgi:hypothetical protein